jgi:hypothetical protein
MPKHDTPAKIAADFRNLLVRFEDGPVTTNSFTRFKQDLAKLSRRLDALPTRVPGWWRMWSREKCKWFAHPIAFGSKRKSRLGIVWRPLDPSDTGPKRPPKEKRA